MRALLVIAAFAGTGCNAVWGIEAADGVLDAGPPSETGNDPCGAEPGSAKVCLTFEGQPHPAYDVSTGADTLRIDGSGVIRLYVFDEDPNDPSVPYTSRLQLPLDGAEISVNAFPTTIPLPVTAGRHWLIAQFEDNKNTSRTGDNSYLAGDFITVPSRTGTGKYVYPMFDAVLDQTARLTVPLQPLRRVNVELKANAAMRTTYKDFAVNGDGPIVYTLFDGAFSATTRFLEFISVRCVNAAPMSLTPPVLSSGFTTVVTGSHNIVASLEDYDSMSSFPTRGSLLTPSEGTLPSITISPTAWTANASLEFATVLDPYRPGERADEQRCP